MKMLSFGHLQKVGPKWKLNEILQGQELKAPTLISTTISEAPYGRVNPIKAVPETLLANEKA